MGLIQFILNALWIVFGGLIMALLWVLAGLIMAVTIVGIPWARAAFNIAYFTLLPFGHEAVPRHWVTGREDIGTGPLGLLGNIIWVVLAGWWLAVGHLVAALAWAITLVGLPFAWAHVKLAALALWPIGQTIVPTGW